MTKRAIVAIAAALGAAALVAVSTTLPLWSLTMRAPQYPKGLHLYAYGTGMLGDLRELNILNHYIGMPPIEAPALETALYPYGIGALLTLCLVSALHRRIRYAAIIALSCAPIAILIDLQWRLYTFGHSLNPHAPIRLQPFTPHVIGTSKMGNFVSTGMISTGVLCLVAAAILLFIADRTLQRIDRAAVADTAAVRTAVAAAIGALLVVSSTSAAPPSDSSGSPLQARIADAAPGGTLVVDGGTHRGPIRIRGPLIVIGTNNPVIDGGGTGSVVIIEGDDVVLRGFTIRNSGRQVTEEAAGITATGNRHQIVENAIHDVYFGIHIGDGAGQIVEGNRIAPGERHGARPGHGISVWHTRDTRLTRNRISNARDGIYLSFTDGVTASQNDITGCRYGMHSMYSQHATFEDNDLRANLLGAALMMSDRLILRRNRITDHRQGSAAYGVLLKDIGDLIAEENVLLANRVAIYAESVPTHPSREAVFAGNTIAGNEVGLALQSNAALTFSENRIADNLTDIRPLGRQISSGARWSRNQRGNSWSQYRGYDADSDGIGDVPHQVDDAMAALVQRNPMAQAFLYTPAHLALEAAVRMFPLYRQPPLAVDPFPLIQDNVRGQR